MKAMLEEASSGWSGGSATTVGKKWIAKHFKNFSSLLDVAPKMKRGTSGNSGSADLSAIPLKAGFDKLIEKIPDKWIPDAAQTLLKLFIAQI